MDKLKRLSKASSLNSGQAPTFTKRLDIKQINDDLLINIKCEFECIVSGDPLPEIKWFKQDIELSDNDHIKITCDRPNGICRLQVSHIQREKYESNRAQFTCVASNEFGQAKTVGLLIINSKATDSLELIPWDHRQCEFLELPPSSVHAREGDDVKIGCKLMGNPEPQVEWFKNGKTLKDDYHIDIYTDRKQNTHYLEICDVKANDTGEYTIEAWNMYNKIREQIHVTIDDNPKLDETKLLLRKELYAYNTRQETYRPPEFITKPISNKIIHEGTNLQITFKVRGLPKPEISWFKNGKPIRVDDDARFKLYERNDEHFFEINNVSILDTSEYTCTASNFMGAVYSAVNILVEAMTEPETNSCSEVDSDTTNGQLPLIKRQRHSSSVHSTDSSLQATSEKLKKELANQLVEKHVQEHIRRRSSFNTRQSDSDSRDVSVHIEECILLQDYKDEQREITLFKGDILEILDATKPEKWLVRSKSNLIQVCYIPPEIVQLSNSTQSMEHHQYEFKKSVFRSFKYQSSQETLVATQSLKQSFKNSSFEDNFEATTRKALTMSSKKFTRNLSAENNDSILINKDSTASSSSSEDLKSLSEDLQEVHFANCDFMPIATAGTASYIALAENQFVEILDSQDARCFLVRTRPRKDERPKIGWVPSCFLEKKSTSIGQVNRRMTRELDKDDLRIIDLNDKSQIITTKRNYSLIELLNTEETYIHDLNYIIEEKKKKSNDIIIENDIDAIFSILQNMYLFHNNILLPKLVDCEGDIDKLSKEAFIDNKNYFKQYYIAYAFNLRQLLQSSLDQHEHMDYLNRPIDRIHIYKHFLQEQIKYSVRSKQSILQLQDAYYVFCDLIKMIDTKNILNNVQGIPLTLLQAHNFDLIHRFDSLNVFDTFNKIKERYCLLLNDILIILKAKSKYETGASYVFTNCIQISSINSLQEKEDDNLSIDLLILNYNSDNINNDRSILRDNNHKLTLQFKNLNIKLAFVRILKELMVHESVAGSENSQVSPKKRKLIPYKRNQERSQIIDIDQQVNSMYETIVTERAMDEEEEEENIITETFVQEYQSPKSSIASFSFKNEDFLSPHSYDTESSYHTATGGDHTSDVTKSESKPLILNKQQSIITLENETVTLECKIKSNPKALIQWFKGDNKFIQNTIQFMYIEDDINNTYKLLIRKPSTSDSGVYRLVATNKHGEAVSFFKLTVNSLTINDGSTEDEKEEEHDLTVRQAHQAIKITQIHHENDSDNTENDVFEEYEDIVREAMPLNDNKSIIDEQTQTDLKQFLKKLDDYVQTQADLNIYLEVRLNFEAKTVKWLKNGELLVDSGDYKYQFQSDNNSYTLVISECNEYDCGYYTVLVDNELKSECLVEIVHDYFFEKELSSEILIIDDYLLDDYSNSITLDCQLNIRPTLKPKWFKNNKPLVVEDTSKYELITEHNIFALIIDNLNELDEGIYRCEYGDKSTECLVMNRLEVLNDLNENLLIINGESCTLSFRLTRELAYTSRIITKWYKNDQEISIHDDNTTKYWFMENTYERSLIIKNTTSEDQACYRAMLIDGLNDQILLETKSCSLHVNEFKEELKLEIHNELVEIGCLETNVFKIEGKLTRSLRQNDLIQLKQDNKLIASFIGKDFLLNNTQVCEKLRFKFINERFEIQIDNRYESCSTYESIYTLTIVEFIESHVETEQNYNLSEIEFRLPGSSDAINSTFSDSPPSCIEYDSKSDKSSSDDNYPLAIECRLNSRLSNEKVKWLKNNEELHLSGDKYEIIREGPINSLLIYDLNESDAGIYSCQVNNEIRNTRVVIKKRTVKQIRVEQPNYESDENELSSSSSCLTNFSESPPSLIEYNDESASEYSGVQPLSIEFKLNRKTKQKIRWFKEGKEIEFTKGDHDKYEIISEGPINSLLIHDLTREDSGEYMCKIGDNKVRKTNVVIKKKTNVDSMTFINSSHEKSLSDVDDRASLQSTQSVVQYERINQISQVQDELESAKAQLLDNRAFHTLPRKNSDDEKSFVSEINESIQNESLPQYEIIQSDLKKEQVSKVTSLFMTNIIEEKHDEDKLSDITVASCNALDSKYDLITESESLNTFTRAEKLKIYGKCDEDNISIVSDHLSELVKSNYETQKSIEIVEKDDSLSQAQVESTRILGKSILIEEKQQTFVDSIENLSEISIKQAHILTIDPPSPKKVIKNELLFNVQSIEAKDHFNDRLSDVSIESFELVNEPQISAMKDDKLNSAIEQKIDVFGKYNEKSYDQSDYVSALTLRENLMNSEFVTIEDVQIDLSNAKMRRPLVFNKASVESSDDKSEYELQFSRDLNTTNAKISSINDETLLLSKASRDKLLYGVKPAETKEQLDEKLSEFSADTLNKESINEQTVVNDELERNSLTKMDILGKYLTKIVTTTSESCSLVDNSEVGVLNASVSYTTIDQEINSAQKEDQLIHVKSMEELVSDDHLSDITISSKVSYDQAHLKSESQIQLDTYKLHEAILFSKCQEDRLSDVSASDYDLIRSVSQEYLNICDEEEDNLNSKIIIDKQVVTSVSNLKNDLETFDDHTSEISESTFIDNEKKLKPIDTIGELIYEKAQIIQIPSIRQHVEEIIEVAMKETIVSDQKLHEFVPNSSIKSLLESENEAIKQIDSVKELIVEQAAKINSESTQEISVQNHVIQEELISPTRKSSVVSDYEEMFKRVDSTPRRTTEHQQDYFLLKELDLNQTYSEGDDIHLECVSTNEIKNYNWLKDNSIIVGIPNKISIVQEYVDYLHCFKYSLIISESTQFDSGKYSFLCDGCIKSECNVSVNEPALKFVKELDHTIDLNESQTLQIECVFNRSIQRLIHLHYEWKKNSKKLYFSNKSLKYRQDIIDNKLVFTIKNLNRTEDKGKYELTVTNNNDFSILRTSTYLNVSSSLESISENLKKVDALSEEIVELKREQKRSSSITLLDRKRASVSMDRSEILHKNPLEIIRIREGDELRIKFKLNQNLFLNDVRVYLNSHDFDASNHGGDDNITFTVQGDGNLLFIIKQTEFNRDAGTFKFRLADTSEHEFEVIIDEIRLKIVKDLTNVRLKLLPEEIYRLYESDKHSQDLLKLIQLYPQDAQFEIELSKHVKYVEWLMNNSKIVANSQSRFELSNSADCKKHALVIRSCNKVDSGSEIKLKLPNTNITSNAYLKIDELSSDYLIKEIKPLMDVRVSECDAANFTYDIQLNSIINSLVVAIWYENEQILVGQDTNFEYNVDQDLTANINKYFLKIKKCSKTQHKAKYTCQLVFMVRLSNGNQVSIPIRETSAYLYVRERPIELVQGLDNQNLILNENDELTLTCVLTKQDTNYAWFKNGVRVDTLKGATLKVRQLNENSYEYSLNISSCNKHSDEGIYRFEISKFIVSECNIRINETKLELVNGLPTNITKELNGDGTEDELKLECSFNRSLMNKLLNVNFEWRFNDKRIFYSNKSFKYKQDIYESRLVLTIKDLNKSDEGVYELKCLTFNNNTRDYDTLRTSTQVTLISNQIEQDECEHIEEVPLNDVIKIIEESPIELTLKYNKLIRLNDIKITCNDKELNQKYYSFCEDTYKLNIFIKNCKKSRDEGFYLVQTPNTQYEFQVFIRESKLSVVKEIQDVNLTILPEEFYAEQETNAFQSLIKSQYSNQAVFSIEISKTIDNYYWSINGTKIDENDTRVKLLKSDCGRIHELVLEKCKINDSGSNIEFKLIKSKNSEVTLNQGYLFINNVFMNKLIKQLNQVRQLKVKENDDAVVNIDLAFNKTFALIAHHLDYKIFINNKELKSDTKYNLLIESKENSIQFTLRISGCTKEDNNSNINVKIFTPNGQFVWELEQQVNLIVNEDKTMILKDLPFEKQVNENECVSFEIELNRPNISVDVFLNEKRIDYLNESENYELKMKKKDDLIYQYSFKILKCSFKHNGTITIKSKDFETSCRLKIRESMLKFKFNDQNELDTYEHDNVSYTHEFMREIENYDSLEMTIHKDHEQIDYSKSNNSNIQVEINKKGIKFFIKNIKMEQSGDYEITLARKSDNTKIYSKFSINVKRKLLYNLSEERDEDIYDEQSLDENSSEEELTYTEVKSDFKDINELKSKLDNIIEDLNVIKFIQEPNEEIIEPIGQETIRINEKENLIFNVKYSKFIDINSIEIYLNEKQFAKKQHVENFDIKSFVYTFIVKNPSYELNSGLYEIKTPNTSCKFDVIIDESVVLIDSLKDVYLNILSDELYDLKGLEKLLLKFPRSAYFEVRLSKYKDKIEWLLNNQEIKNDTQFTMSNLKDTCTYSLCINNCSLLGSKSKVEFKVLSNCDLSSKASIIKNQIESKSLIKVSKSLDNEYRVKENQSTTLKCVFEVDSLIKEFLNDIPFQIKWYKNDLEINDCTEIRNEKSPLSSSLKLKQLIFSGTPTKYDFKLYLNNECLIENHTYVIVEELVVSTTKKLPSNITVYENDTLELLCELSEPNLDLVWLKNNKPLVNESNFVVNTNNCVYKAKIIDCKISESGTYTIKYRTKTLSSCDVIVKEPKIELVKKFPDTIKAEEYDDVDLELDFSTNIENKKDLSIEWVLNGRVIMFNQNTSKYSYIIIGNKYVFTIHNCSLKDSNKYECIIGHYDNVWTFKTKLTIVKSTKKRASSLQEEKQIEKVSLEIPKLLVTEKQLEAKEIRSEKKETRVESKVIETMIEHSSLITQPVNQEITSNTQKVSKGSGTFMIEQQKPKENINKVERESLQITERNEASEIFDSKETKLEAHQEILQDNISINSQKKMVAEKTLETKKTESAKSTQSDSHLAKKINEAEAEKKDKVDSTTRKTDIIAAVTETINQENNKPDTLLKKSEVVKASPIKEEIKKSKQFKNKDEVLELDAKVVKNKENQDLVCEKREDDIRKGDVTLQKEEIKSDKKVKVKAIIEKGISTELEMNQVKIKDTVLDEDNQINRKNGDNLTINKITQSNKENENSKKEPSETITEKNTANSLDKLNKESRALQKETLKSDIKIKNDTLAEKKDTIGTEKSTTVKIKETKTTKGFVETKKIEARAVEVATSDSNKSKEVEMTTNKVTERVPSKNEDTSKEEVKAPQQVVTNIDLQFENQFKTHISTNLCEQTIFECSFNENIEQNKDLELHWYKNDKKLLFSFRSNKYEWVLNDKSYKFIINDCVINDEGTYHLKIFHAGLKRFVLEANIQLKVLKITKNNDTFVNFIESTEILQVTKKNDTASEVVTEKNDEIAINQVVIEKQGQETSVIAETQKAIEEVKTKDDRKEMVKQVKIEQQDTIRETMIEEIKPSEQEKELDTRGAVKHNVVEEPKLINEEKKLETRKDERKEISQEERIEIVKLEVDEFTTSQVRVKKNESASFIVKFTKNIESLSENLTYTIKFNEKKRNNLMIKNIEPKLQVIRLNFIILNCEINDSGIYDLIIKDSKNESNSCIVSFTVSVIDSNLRILRSFPDYVYANLNESASVECVLESDFCEEMLEYNLFINQKKTSVNETTKYSIHYIQNDQKLVFTVKNCLQTDIGSYELKVTDRQSHSHEVFLTFKLKVVVPKVEDTLEDEENALVKEYCIDEGDTARLLFALEPFSLNDTFVIYKSDFSMNDSGSRITLNDLNNHSLYSLVELSDRIVYSVNKQEKSIQLLIHGCKLIDSGLYICKIKHENRIQLLKANLTIIKFNFQFINGFEPIIDLKQPNNELVLSCELNEIKDGLLSHLKLEFNSNEVSIEKFFDKVDLNGNRIQFIKNKIGFEHCGTYSLSVLNDEDQNTTTCQVSIRTPIEQKLKSPRITLLGDESLTIPIGSPLSLRAHIENFAECSVKWYHNGTNEIADDDLHIFIYLTKDPEVNDLYLAELKVNSCCEYDEGSYVCRLFTSGGVYESQSFNVSIDKCINLEEIKQTDQAPPLAFSNEPKFIEKIKDCYVVEGRTCVFECVINGSSFPNVSAFVDNHEVKSLEGEKYRLEVDSNTGIVLFYVFNSLKSNDETEFTLKIENEHGFATCSAYLFIEKEQDDALPQVQQLDHIELVAPKGLFILECDDTNYELTWSREHASSSFTYLVEVMDSNTRTWTLFKTNIKSNSLIIQSNEVDLKRIVSFRVRVDYNNQLSEPSDCVSISPKIHEETMDIFNGKIDNKPKIYGQKRDTFYYVENQKLSIKFNILGNPNPNVKWFLNETELRNDNKKYIITSNHTKSEYELEFLSPTESDEGAYRVVYGNEYGKSEHVFKLYRSDAPIFIEPFKECLTINKFKQATLTLKVNGIPYPEVKFYKDWHLLSESSRIKIKHLKPDTWMLSINSTIDKDTGLYTCVAKNQVGSTYCSCMLKIDDSIILDNYNDNIMYPTINTPFKSQIIFKKSFSKDYKIIEKISNDDRCVFYRVESLTTCKEYYAKTCLKKSHLNELKNEASLLMKLSSDISFLHDVYEIRDGNLMILFEKPNNCSNLIDYLFKQNDELNERKVALLVKNLLEVLNRLNEYSIAHLNLTIDNIHVTRDGKIKLSGFESAQLIKFNYLMKKLEINETSIEFLAPEILSNKELTLNTDSWSIGVLTYMLLYGQSPFYNQTSSLITRENILKLKYTFPSIGTTQTSPQAKDFIEKLLQLNSFNRLSLKQALNHSWIINANHKYHENKIECQYARQLQSRFLYNKIELTQKTCKNIDHEILLVNNEDDECSTRLNSLLLPIDDANFAIRLRQYDSSLMHKAPKERSSLGRGMSLPRMSTPSRESISMNRSSSLTRGPSHSPSSINQSKEQFLNSNAWSTNSKPIFKKKLQTISFVLGQTIRLSCAVDGSPLPSTCWFKNDRLIDGTNSRYVFKQLNDGHVELCIRKANINDIGLYKCEARNKNGLAYTKALVQIASEPDPTSRPLVTYIGAQKCYLIWNRPKFDGNSPILCYKIEYKRPIGDLYWKVACYSQIEECLVDCLSPLNSYRFRISALNAIGASRFSFASEEIQTTHVADENEMKLIDRELVNELLDSQQKIISDYEKAKLNAFNVNFDVNETNKYESSLLLNTFVHDDPCKKYSKDRLILRKGTMCIYSSNNKQNLIKFNANSYANEIKFQVNKQILELIEGFNYTNEITLVYSHAITLIDFISLRRMYSDELVVNILRQVCDAIQWIHAKNYLHLNLNPLSIFNSNTSYVDIKLSGFECSIENSLKSKQHLNSVIKLNAYMLEFLAPELIDNNETSDCYSFASDIWSIGLLTTLLLSGTLLKNKDDIKYRRLCFDEFYENISNESIDFILKCLKLSQFNRLTISQCIEHKYLQLQVNNMKRRETLFPTDKLRLLNKKLKQRFYV